MTRRIGAAATAVAVALVAGTAVALARAHTLITTPAITPPPARRRTWLTPWRHR